MKGLSDRLKLLRGKQSQADFAAAIGVSSRSVSRYETGAGSPDLETIDKICVKFGVKPEWLLFGKMPMRRDGEEAQAPHPEQGSHGNAASWQPPVYIRPSIQDDPWKAAKWQEVPLIGLGNCGTAGWFTPEQLALRVTLPIEYPYTPDMFAVLAVGTSMQPEGIRQGYVVFCNPSVALDPGDAVYVERKDNIAAIKKYLKIDNDKLYLQGWKEPSKEGVQEPYYEEIELSKIKRMSCVVIIKRKA